MLGLLVLFFLYGLLHLKPQARHPLLREKRDKAAAALGLAFVFAGGQHFTETENLNWLTSSTRWIHAAGVVAIVAGLAMLPRRSRRVAGAVIAALVLALLPADIYFHERDWYLLARIPVQLVYLGWIVFAIRERA